MANWLQRLETAWSRRYVRSGAIRPTAGEGRKPVCVITGGSEGIGRHLAGEFAANGHRLLLIARSAGRLSEAAEELRQNYGADVHTASIDLTAPDYKLKLSEVLDRHGLYVDILVNNAGIGLGGPFTDQEPERILDLCRLNVEALTELTRAYLPPMLERARGGVLNIASLGGLLPGPYQAAYYASKAYVVSLTEALAYENAGRGVRISAAIPGPVATRFHERMGASNAFYLHLQRVLPPETAARIIYSGFMGRRTLIAPGLMASFNSFAVRLIPHAILTPFIGWFLKQRY
ncbi:MAG: SDR family oxidoreductase [Rhodomicrobium sp.]|nr:SDR family oxidoreductase [Rhodomicrobium sp.]